MKILKWSGFCGGLLLLAAASYAQEGGQAPGLAPAPAPVVTPGGGEEEMVQLNFPEAIEIQTLIDYVSKRLKINIILADESFAARKVSISSPKPIPKSSLFGLMQSVLQMVGLAVVDADQPGWKKVVQCTNLPSVVTEMRADPTQPAVSPPMTVATQVFELRNVTAPALETSVKLFLSKPGGNCISIPERGLIIVTDYTANIQRVATLIDLVDRPGRGAGIQFVSVKNMPAVDLVKQINEFLSEKDRVSAGGGRSAARALTLIAEPRTNQIAVISTDGSRNAALELIRTLDVPEVEQTTSNIRIYKLLNTTAPAVLATIRALGTGAKISEPPSEGESGSSRFPTGERYTGPNYPPPTLGQPLPTPPAYQTPPAAPAASEGASAEGKDARWKTPTVTVTADVNTNSIIVLGPPDVQTMYKQLIAALDKRRPQVMLEITLVTIDDAASQSLGIELSRLIGANDRNKAALFSSFGLNTVDPTTGGLSIEPGIGFNGVVLAPNTVNIVLRALATTAKTRVLACPKVLVNDHASATLTSVAEQPFTSVNASQTVSTTSFAGYATAGTTITATPHISEGDHLQLQYAVTLNAFSGKGSEGIPPPRQTNAVNSEITVPDGSTVVTGGLTINSNTDTVSKVPILGDLPLLGPLFRSTEKSKDRSRLYVFIRPIILRDDRFEDLKYLSGVDRTVAKLPTGLPKSEPIPMR